MKWRLIQPSLDTERLTRARVSSTSPDTDEFWKRLVAKWAEFQQSVVERNITFSQINNFAFHKVVK